MHATNYTYYSEENVDNIHCRSLFIFKLWLYDQDKSDFLQT